MRFRILLVSLIVLSFCAMLLPLAQCAEGEQLAQIKQAPKPRIEPAKVLVRPLKPLLIALPDLTVSISGPDRAAAGSSVNLKVNVTNKGRGKALGTTEDSAKGYMVDLILSSDGSFPVEYATQPVYAGLTKDDFVEDMLLLGGRISNTKSLAGGASTQYTISVPIPRKTAPGVYCLGAVVDPGTKVWESNEANNVTCLRITVSAESMPPVDLPPQTTTWVMPYGIGGTKLYQIKPNGYTDSVGTIGGVPIVDAPFASRLGFRHGYSSAIPNTSMKYYRWLYRPSGGAWTEFTEAVNVHYVREQGGTTTFPVYNLGPQSVSGKNLYEFRPSAPPSIPGSTTYWPTTDWFGDIYSGFLNSRALPNGLHQIKLEIYSAAGAQVMPGPGTFKFIIPTSVAPDGTIHTANGTSVSGGGYVFNLQIDNRSCGAMISPPAIGSSSVVGPCGFLHYAAKTQNVDIHFTAAHPANHAMFLFRIVRGTTEVSRAVGDVSAGSVGGYTGDGSGGFSRSPTVASLLGPCPEKAAFSENLYVYAKATNGWTRQHGLDARYVRAFALAPVELY